MYHEPGHETDDHMHVTVVAVLVLANGTMTSEPNTSQSLPRAHLRRALLWFGSVVDTVCMCAKHAEPQYQQLQHEPEAEA